MSLTSLLDTTESVFHVCCLVQVVVKKSGDNLGSKPNPTAS